LQRERLDQCDPSSDRLWRPPSPARGEGVKHGRSALLIPRPKTRRILSSPRREERAHGQRPIAAAGGDRAGALVGGGGDSATSSIPEVVDPGTQKRRWTQADESDRRMETSASGIWLRGRTRPPEASRASGCEQHHDVTLPDNDRAERLASSKRYSSNLHRTASGAPRPFPSLQRSAA
jgi:hypothetical protein